jgi:hypothetical protein
MAQGPQLPPTNEPYPRPTIKPKRKGKTKIMGGNQTYSSTNDKVTPKKERYTKLRKIANGS